MSEFAPNTLQEQIELLDLLTTKEQDLKYNKFKYLYPDTGPYRHDLYPVHMKFFNASENHIETALIAGNGTGKTVAGSFATVCHLTGEYPGWWKGRKFDRPTTGWCVGLTAQQIKKGPQNTLLGPPNDFGSGVLPQEKLHARPRMKAGVPDGVETFYVPHSSGGISSLTFMACDQERRAFQGPSIDFIWIDEEPDKPGIYSECIARLRNPERMGIVYSTFTPLSSLSDVCLSFLPGGIMPEDGIHPDNPQKFVAKVSMYEVPHLTKEYIETVKSTCEPHLMRARIYGDPVMGSGTVYPYALENIVCAPRKIEAWWPRAYGLDVGWNRTAAVWVALDPDTHQMYVYSEHYSKETLPPIHAVAIKGRGEWITGAIDPAASGINASDGKALFEIYETDNGLNIVNADNSVESGIYKVGQAFAAGQLKIFDTCKHLLAEYRVYHRDEKGRIVKKNDHALDALRYCIMTWNEIADVEPDPDARNYVESEYYHGDRDPITGY
jgi:phage terminase large subunit-like protein